MPHPAHVHIDLNNLSTVLQSIDYVVFDWSALFDGNAARKDTTASSYYSSTAPPSKDLWFRLIPGVTDVIALLSNANANLQFAAVHEVPRHQQGDRQRMTEENDRAFALLTSESKGLWQDNLFTRIGETKENTMDKPNPSMLLHLFNSMSKTSRWADYVKTNKRLPLLYIGVDPSDCSAALGAGCCYCDAAALYGSLSKLTIWSGAASINDCRLTHVAGKWWERPEGLVLGTRPDRITPSLPLSCNVQLYIHDFSGENLLTHQSIQAGTTPLTTTVPIIIDFGEDVHDIMSRLAQRLGIRSRSTSSEGREPEKNNWATLGKKCKHCGFVHTGHVHNDGTWVCKNCKDETSAELIELPLSMITLYALHPVHGLWEPLVSTRMLNKDDTNPSTTSVTTAVLEATAVTTGQESYLRRARTDSLSSEAQNSITAVETATGLALESHIVSAGVSFGSHAEKIVKKTTDFVQWDCLQQIQVCVVIAQTSEDELKCVALDMSDQRSRERLQRQIVASALEDVYTFGDNPTRELKVPSPSSSITVIEETPSLVMRAFSDTHGSSDAIDAGIRESHFKHEALYLLATSGGIRANMLMQTDHRQEMHPVRVICELDLQHGRFEGDKIIWKGLGNDSGISGDVHFKDVISITTKSIQESEENPTGSHDIIIECAAGTETPNLVFRIRQEIKRNSFAQVLSLIHGKMPKLEGGSDSEFMKLFAHHRASLARTHQDTISTLKTMASYSAKKDKRRSRASRAGIAEDGLTPALETEVYLEKLLLLQENSGRGGIEQFAAATQHLWGPSIEGRVREESREAARTKRRSKARLIWSMKNSGIFEQLRNGAFDLKSIDELRTVTHAYTDVFAPVFDKAEAARKRRSSDEKVSDSDTSREKDAINKIIALVRREVKVMDLDRMIHDIQARRLNTFLEFHWNFLMDVPNETQQSALSWLRVQICSMQRLWNNMIRRQTIHEMETLRGMGSHETVVTAQISDSVEIPKLRVQYVIAAMQKELAVKAKCIKGQSHDMVTEEEAVRNMKRVTKTYAELMKLHNWVEPFFGEDGEEISVKRWKNERLYGTPSERCEHVEFLSSTGVGRQYLNAQRAKRLVSNFEKVTSDGFIQVKGQKRRSSLLDDKVTKFVEKEKQQRLKVQKEYMLQKVPTAIKLHTRSVEQANRVEEDLKADADRAHWAGHAHDLETENAFPNAEAVVRESRGKNSLRTHSERRLVSQEGETKEVHLDHNFVQTELGSFTDSVKKSRCMLSRGFVATKHGSSNKAMLFNLISTSGKPHERFFWLDQRTGSLCWENVAQAAHNRETLKNKQSKSARSLKRSTKEEGTGRGESKGEDNAGRISADADMQTPSAFADANEFDLDHSKKDQGKHIRFEKTQGEPHLCVVQTYDSVRGFHRLLFPDGTVQEYDLLNTSGFHRYTVEPETKPNKGIHLKNILRVERGFKFHKPKKGWTSGVSSEQCLTLSGPFFDGYGFLELEFPTMNACQDVYEGLQRLLFLRDPEHSPFRTLDMITSASKTIEGTAFILADRSKARKDRFYGPSQMKKVSGSALPSGKSASRYYVRVENGNITASDAPKKGNAVDWASSVRSDWAFNRLAVPCIVSPEDFNPDWSSNKELRTWLAEPNKYEYSAGERLKMPQGGGVLLVELTNGSILDGETQANPCTLIIFVKHEIGEWFTAVKSQIRAFRDNYDRAPVLEKFDMEILPAHVHSGSAVVIALQSYAEDNGIGVSDDNSDNNAHFDVVCPPQPSMVMVRDGIIEVMEAQYKMTGTTLLGGGEHTLDFDIDSVTTAELLSDKTSYESWADNKYVKRVQGGPDAGVIRVRNHRNQVLLMFVADSSTEWHEAVVSQVRATVTVDVRAVSIGAQNTYAKHTHEADFAVARVGKSYVKK